METGKLPVREHRKWVTKHNGVNIEITYNGEFDDLGMTVDGHRFVLADEQTNRSLLGLREDRQWFAEIDDSLFFVINYDHEEDTMNLSVRETTWSALDLTEAKENS